MAVQRAPVDHAIPDAKHSETRLRPSSPVVSDLRNIAERFRDGEFHTALLDAMRLLDSRPVPYLRASPTYLASAALTSAARLLITLVDDATPLEDLFEQCGLGLVEGIETTCVLVDDEIIVFDPDIFTKPLTLRGPDCDDQDVQGEDVRLCLRSP